MNCSNFYAFPPFFPSEKVKLDSFVVLQRHLCLALLAFLSWSSPSLRELSNFSLSLRNSTAWLLHFLLLLFFFFFFTSTSPSAPHLLLLSPKRSMAFFWTCFAAVFLLLLQRSLHDLLRTLNFGYSIALRFKAMESQTWSLSGVPFL